jgi:hypothetical protein
MLALLLAAALAWDSPDCNLGVDFDREPVSVPVPGPPGRAFAWAASDPTTGVERAAGCMVLDAVPEPHGAAEILRISAELAARGLQGHDVVTRAFTWNDHPALAVELDGTVLARPARIRMWYVVVGSRVLQVQVTAPPDRALEPTAGAFFGSLRVLRDLGERPPSQLPATFATWTSPDGVVTVEAPGQPHGDVRELPTATPTGPIPFRVMGWYAPGHGTFGVRWARLPAAFTAGRTPAQVLDALIAAQTGPMQLEEVRATDVPGGRDLVGVMGVMRDRGRWPARVLVRLDGDLAVVLVVHGREGEVSTADADRMVASLRVKP